jgi:hypothetical protein
MFLKSQISGLGRLPLILLLTACVFLSGFTNCSISKLSIDSQLTKAAKASRSIANYTGDAIALVKTLYESGAIKLEVKDKLAASLKQFAITGKDFNDFVAGLSQQYKDGTVPANIWSLITTKFDALTKVFVDLLDLIPSAAGLGDSKAFKIITAGVVQFAQILLSVGVNVPAWERIEKAFPNWRQLIGPSSVFQKEVLA